MQSLEATATARGGVLTKALKLLMAVVLALGMMPLPQQAFASEPQSLAAGALSIAPMEDGATWEGEGTAESPYLLTNEADLVAFQEAINADKHETYGKSDTATYTGKYFKLTNDVELTSGWVPVGKSTSLFFAGTFDGDGHTISNVSITAAEGTTTAHCGFFGLMRSAVDGTSPVIKNLKIAGAGTETAHIVGNNGSSTTVGGIIGYANANTSSTVVPGTITIDNCVTDINLKGFRYVGGIAGQANQGVNITNCLVLGNVEAMDAGTTAGSYAGGILGTYTSTGNKPNFKNNLFLGQITPSENYASAVNAFANTVNALIGKFNGDNADTPESTTNLDNVTNNYYVAQNDTQVKAWRMGQSSAIQATEPSEGMIVEMPETQADHDSLATTMTWAAGSLVESNLPGSGESALPALTVALAAGTHQGSGKTSFEVSADESATMYAQVQEAKKGDVAFVEGGFAGSDKGTESDIADFHVKWYKDSVDEANLLETQDLEMNTVMGYPKWTQDFLYTPEAFGAAGTYKFYAVAEWSLEGFEAAQSEPVEFTYTVAEPAGPALAVALAAGTHQGSGKTSFDVFTGKSATAYVQVQDAKKGDVSFVEGGSMSASETGTQEDIANFEVKWYKDSVADENLVDSAQLEWNEYMERPKWTTDFMFRPDAFEAAGTYKFYAVAEWSVEGFEAAQSEPVEFTYTVADAPRSNIVGVADPAEGGALSFRVNGEAATQAFAEDEVEVIAEPAEGYVLGPITVVDANGGAVRYNDYSRWSAYYDYTGTFEMPSTDATVTAKFDKVVASDIEVVAGEHGSAVCTLNGEEVTSAQTGDSIRIAASPEYGYEVDAISVTDAQGNVISSGASFTMPSSKATVSVTFKELPKFNVTKASSIDAAQGDISFDKETFVDGDVINVTISPADGYEIDAITCYEADGTTEISTKYFYKEYGYNLDCTIAEDGLSAVIDVANYWSSAHTDLVVGATFKAAPAGLNVYEMAEGDSEPALVKSYKASELAALKSAGAPVAGLYVGKGGSWNVNVAYDYVTFADLLSDAGVEWAPGDSVEYTDALDGTGFGAGSKYGYDALYAGKFFPKTTASATDASGAVAAEPVLALTEWSGAIDSTAGACIEDFEGLANADRAPRVVMGASEDDYLAGNAAGKRFVSGVKSVTVVHPEQASLNVYEMAEGDSEPTLVKSYKASELAALKSAGAPVAGLFQKSGWQVNVAYDYVTFADLLSDAGVEWAPGDSVEYTDALDGTGFGAGSKYGYDALYAGKFFPKTTTGATDASGAVAAEPVLALTEWSGAIDSTAGACIEDFEGLANASRAPRAITGVTEDDYLAGNAPGKRFVSGVKSVTVVHQSKVDKSALEEAIAAAQAAEEGVKESADGKDVAPADKWVAPAAKAALDDAIAAAQAASAKEGATQAEVDAAKAALEQATQAFEAAKKPGTLATIAKVTAADVVYAGAAKLPAPKLTVLDKAGKAVPAGAYTVTVSYNKGHDPETRPGISSGGYAGKATVKVAGVKSKGYAGSASASFKVTTAADKKKAGTKIDEKTLAGIDKYKASEKGKAGYVGQASSKTMETIAVPKKKTMTVRWKAVTGATDYIVGYKRSTAREWSYEMSGGKTEHTFANMREGDLMEFRVAVYNGNRFVRGEWTQINCRFYREMVSLKATVGKGKVDLKWGKVSGATGYQVLVATKADMSDQKVVDVKGGSTLKATVKSFGGKALQSGKTYYIKMRAVREATNKNGKKNTYIGIHSLKRTCKVK